jgi:phosphatidylethanolamine N-methyltransferase
MTEPGIIAASFHLASRLAYVIGVGVALTLEDRHQALTRDDGPDLAFKKFRRVAATLMIVDCASFILLCIATPRTLPIHLPTALLIVTGGVLVVLGAWMKTWAAVRIGFRACYWHNFFFPCDPRAQLDPPGPYRFLKNPMYTLGYAYTYGLALIFGSLPGLLFAAFDQAAILAFYHIVEKPHFEQLLEATAYESGVAGD